jgi:hypothetical protein
MHISNKARAAPWPAATALCTVLLSAGTFAQVPPTIFDGPDLACHGPRIRVLLRRTTPDPGALTTVSIDPVTRTVLGVQGPETRGATATILLWARDLHEGRGLGPIWRGLVFLAGVLLPLLPVTGVALWFIKRRNRRRAASAGQSVRAGAANPTQASQTSAPS